MSAEKLAFLQNFYTDVTLYVPAEAVTPNPAPAAAAPPAAVPAPAAQVQNTAPPKPVREIALPPTGFSRPSAGLERLSSNYNHPAPASEPPAALIQHSSTASERVADAPERSAGASENSAKGLSPLQDAPVVPAAAPAVPPVMLTPFTTLGDNAQGVILLFRLPPDQFRKLHRNVFLNKMLQALNLIMEDVVLVNVDSDLPVALTNLRRELAATHIVAFGKNLLDTTIRNTQIYEPVLFPNLNLAYLSSATVELVEYDVSLKKRLWPGLQRMFIN